MPATGGDAVIERPVVDLDVWHSEIVDRVCASDAERVRAGDERFIRLAVDHEFCIPGACVEWPSVVIVTAIAPGLRSRWPVRMTGAAA